MNQVLQHHPLPLASENPFSSEQDSFEHIGGHAHHSFSAAGPPDQLRRDGFGHSTTRILNALPPSNLTSRSSAPRSSLSYQSGTTLSDPGSGSISASPNSNASSALNFSPFTQPATSVYSSHIPVANNFSPSAPYQYGNYGTSTMSSMRRTSSITDPPPSTMLPPNHTVSPSMAPSARDNYTTSPPGMIRHPHTHTLSPRHSDISHYSSIDNGTPRSVLPTTMSMSASSAYGNTISSYGPTSAGESPPFNAQETFVDITCEGNKVVPTIEAKIDKGFFWSPDNVWTCYRRNYFAVTVSYGLSPWYPNGRLYINRGGKGPEQIQSMAVSLAAAIDASGGKAIELIQHTPKRDKGPQLQMKKELLSPTPPGKSHDHGSYGLGNFHQTTTVAGPLLPLQTESESTHSYSPTSHSTNTYQQAFERIQFKSATANNGKRRAQQQYYHLIVELWANVQNPRDPNPDWVRVGQRCSSHVVVRGRSPSHYSNEGPHNSNASRGGGGSTGMGGPGHQSLGSNGGPAYGPAYSRMSMNGPSSMGGGGYRGNTYSLDPSPVGSHSVSSASSLSGGPVEGLVDQQHMVDDEENKHIENSEGYQYFPHTIYENVPSKMETHGLPPIDRRIKEEYPGSAALSTNWSVGGCRQYQGVDTSRGYYNPDVYPVGY